MIKPLDAENRSRQGSGKVAGGLPARQIAFTVAAVYERRINWGSALTERRYSRAKIAIHFPRRRTCTMSILFR